MVTRSKIVARCSMMLCALVTGVAGTAVADFNLRVQTDLGSFDMVMYDDVSGPPIGAPLTVANFMNYVNRADYDGSFIHRSVPGFVVQGGGYVFDPALGGIATGGVTSIPTDPPVVNEFGRSNLRGTVAMAKMPGNPNSATSEFFFNLADNSASLDTQNGGFTVFAEVLGNGMTVVDAIAALPLCNSVFAAFLCSQQPYTQELPLADDTPAIDDNVPLINIRIGLDNDLDGVIDRLEDLAPNNGDGNNDGTADSQQQHVASMQDDFGGELILVSPVATPVSDVSIYGATFRRANPQIPGSRLDSYAQSGIAFAPGGAGFSQPVAAPGGAVSVTLTLPPGTAPDNYWNFGPTPTNPTPHWYQFVFDPVSGTGAQFNNNVVTLTYVDGERGDSDLDNANGIIESPPGFPGVDPGDLDGIPDGIEDAGPNSGDANSDGTPDSQQQHVVSFPDIASIYLLLETSPTTPVEFTTVLDNSFAAANPPDPGSLLESLINAGMVFTHGYIDYTIDAGAPGGTVTVTLTLPAGEMPDTFFNFGPTPTNNTPHWYEFIYDPVTGTGAQFSGNVVTLHYVDGLRGDNDLDSTNGIIDVAPGGSAERPDDLDGIPDSIEDAGPNNGDANNDGILDSKQQNIVSFQDPAGVYLLLETPVSSPVENAVVLDASFGITNPPDPGSLLETLINNGMLFTHGYLDYSMDTGTPGSTVTVTLTLPAGENPDTFFNFGPTPTNNTPHWYEFIYDPVTGTGAQFSGNVVTLHYVDGLRGDNDLDNTNGIIDVAPGGSAEQPGDLDGVPDSIEDAGPNGGDGNNDGTLDSQQPNVTSLPDIRGNYLTIAATTASHALQEVAVIDGSFILAVEGPMIPGLQGLNFAFGFVDFEIHNVGPGGSATVDIIFPVGVDPVDYYMYGPTTANMTDHLYEFNFDGVTGAQFSGNKVTLNFVDGGRGDADMDNTNGIIDDPGAPAVFADSIPPEGGGGCSLRMDGGRPAQSGAWWLMLSLGLIYTLRRNRRQL